MAAVKGLGTGDDTDHDKDGGDADSDKGVAQGGPEPTAVVVETPTPDKEVNWEARYRTLQGKFDAEVPRLHEELRDLKNKIVTGLLEGRSTAVAPKVETDLAADEINDLLTTGRQTFGEDLIDFVDSLIQRRSQVVAKGEVKGVQDRVDSAEEAQLERERKDFAGQMAGLVPEGLDWHGLMVGQDPDFQEFLDSEEPNGLFTYRELMSKANDGWDAKRLAKIFEAYTGKQAPAATVVAPVVPKPDPQKEALDKARVAPARTTPVEVTVDAEARIWTPAMVKEFEKNDRLGKYDKETSKAMWNDLLLAPGEGRFIK